MYFLSQVYERPLYHYRFPISRLKEPLSKHFRIVVVEETGDALRCIILRRWRIIGTPWFGPHTKLKIQITEDGSNYKIVYRFFYPEYIFYWVISLLVATLGVLSANEPPQAFEIATGFVTFFILSSVFSLLVFIDTKFFYDRFKRLAKNF